MTTTLTLSALLAEGLTWLYRTEQPADALHQHHGVSSPILDNRRYRFVPRGARSLPVVVTDVARRQYDNRHASSVLLNPIRPTELDELAALMASLGHQVVDRWNGYPSETGSVALAGLAHPTLLAAVNRYQRGCLTHPQESVFCDCGWYQAGHDRMALPFGYSTQGATP